MLWLVAFADTFVLNAYFNWAGSFLGSPQVGIKGNWIMPIMSIGQVAEIPDLAWPVLGAALKRFGWRLTMIVRNYGTRPALWCVRLFSRRQPDLSS